MTYPIFKENSQSKIHSAYFVGMILLLVFLLKIFFSEYFWFIPNFIIYISLIYGLGLVIWNWDRYEVENGKFIGSFQTQSDKIIILNNEIGLIQISKLDFIGYDTKGAKNVFNIFDARNSNGLKNRINITLKDGSTIEHQFQQTQGTQLKLDMENLLCYYQHGKISWLKLTTILQLNDNESKKLKSKITNANKSYI